MKKQTLIFTSLLLLTQSSFAVTEQLEFAQKELISLSSKIHNDESEQIQNEIILTNKVSASQAVAPKNDIKFGQKNNLLNEYQEQNALKVTGVFDQQTLTFVQEKQKEFDFNITKTLDLNTWFATYNQSDSWKKNVLEKSVSEWEEVISKQKSSLSNKFIVVNIPSMTLTAYEWNNDQSTSILTSKVVIGKVSSQTPLDDFLVWGIKYNPNWTPTSNMLKKNVFKGENVNTLWLISHHIKAINSEGEEIPYSQITKHDNLRFSQPAGNSNALGILKFETNSKENIYLHDTNEKALFSHNSRAYSSGCIRVQSFMELAQWIGQIDEITLRKKLNNKNTRIEKTSDKIPVYFTYSQVEIKNGKALFSPDIYNRNKNTLLK